MKFFKLILTLVALLLLVTPAQAQDFSPEKSCLAYHVDKTMFLFKDITVWGTSCDLDASLTPSPAGLVAKVAVVFASFDSKEEKRDGELQENFFFVAKYPKITFTSNPINEQDLGRLKAGEAIELKGGLTIMALASEVTFIVSLKEGRLTGKMSDSITRLGVTPPKMLGGAFVSVHDPVEVHLDLIVDQIAGANAALQ